MDFEYSVFSEPPVSDDSIADLAQAIGSGGYVALTGAGMSTESGIPAYRGRGETPRARNPIRYREFVADPEVRKRYWARSAIGWPRMKSSRPNDAHRALARLEQARYVTGTITQNVDGLHRKAGSRCIIELHGALDEVTCLSCSAGISRDRMQQLLVEMNPSIQLTDGHAAPDGDADLPDSLVSETVVPECALCGGILKPDVVFFGENVPGARVSSANRLVDASDGLLVLGTSLTVYSGCRFVNQALRRGIPVVIVTLSATRADGQASLIVNGRLGDVMPRLATALRAADSTR